MSLSSLLIVMVAFNSNMFRLDKPEDKNIRYVKKEYAYAESSSINRMKIVYFESLNHFIMKSLYSLFVGFFVYLREGV